MMVTVWPPLTPLTTQPGRRPSAPSDSPLSTTPRRVHGVAGHRTRVECAPARSTFQSCEPARATSCAVVGRRPDDGGHGNCSRGGLRAIQMCFQSGFQVAARHAGNAMARSVDVVGPLVVLPEVVWQAGCTVKGIADVDLASTPHLQHVCTDLQHHRTCGNSPTVACREKRILAIQHVPIFGQVQSGWQQAGEPPGTRARDVGQPWSLTPCEALIARGRAGRAGRACACWTCAVRLAWSLVLPCRSESDADADAADAHAAAAPPPAQSGQRPASIRRPVRCRSY